jgi:LysR family transcriptional regulator, transcriptional activator of the cysJI operon
LEIRQLKYFSEIMRTRNISQAAANLSMTQPALSQQIALLERELDCTLFIRSRLGMRPTAAGEELAGRVASILQGVEDLESAMKPRKKKSQISFAVGETLAAHFVPPLLSALRRRFPDTRFRVIESNLTEIKAALRNSEVDFALSPETISGSAYENRYLVSDEIQPVVGQDDPLTQGKASIQQLRESEWILFHPGSAIRKICDRLLKKPAVHIQPKISMELRSVSGVVHCLEAGLGVGFISNLSLTTKLRILPIQELASRRKFYLTYRIQNRTIGPVLDEIINYAKSWR